MTERHLEEQAVEALAHDRGDLAEEWERTHVERCESCAALVQQTRALSAATADSLRQATPELSDVDLLVRQALAIAEPAGAALQPSRRALVVGAGVGVLAALGFGLASLPAPGAVFRWLRDGVSVATAVDRLVTVALPGGWMAVAVAGFLVLLAVGLPFRSLVLAAARPVRPGPLLGLVSLALLLCIGVPASRALALELEGDWPAQERVVTVSVDHEPATVALRQAAESAGLGLVATLEQDPEVTLHVRDASLRDVVEAVLGDAPLVVRRTESMLIIRPVGTETPTPGKAPELALAPDHPEPPAPPPPPAAPVPPEPPSGSFPSRTTFGGDVRVAAGETVQEIVTMGGDAFVEGAVQRDVVTMGGDVRVGSGGVVHGDVVTMGGDLEVDEGGAVWGEAVTMGGEVTYAEGAQIGAGASSGRRRWRDRDGSRGWQLWRGQSGASEVSTFLGDMLGSAAKHALLFLLGLVLMAVFPERVGALRRMIRRSPVRSVAVGVLGFVGATVLTVVLAITIIGIPGAIVVALLAFLAVYVGLAAVSLVLGGALPIDRLRDRPVLQLGAGILILYVISLLPAVGWLATVIASTIGFGAVLLTRFGRTAPGEAPAL